MRKIALLLSLFCGFLSACQQQEEFVSAAEDQNTNANARTAALPNNVTATRLATLSKGVNLAHWFAQGTVSTSYIQGRNFGPTDFNYLKSIGIMHVRLPISDLVLFQENNPSVLNPTYTGLLDNAINQILASGLGVIVDFHPEEAFKQNVYTNKGGNFITKVSSFWGTLAKRYASKNANKLFFEVMNEPASENPQTWYTAQTTIMKSIRTNAPNQTIIADGNLRASINDWNGMTALRAITPSTTDRNIVYNFHYYDAMVFTHQGATWGWGPLQYMKNVPYPSSTAAVAPILAAITDQTARDAVAYYGTENWNYTKHYNSLKLMSDWAKAQNVSITCNEIGVYKLVAPSADRLVYLKDVRTALQTLQIGWNVWEYDYGFGVADTSPTGVRTVAPAMKTTLGL